jgi:hypothetical protein
MAIPSKVVLEPFTFCAKAEKTVNRVFKKKQGNPECDSLERGSMRGLSSSSGYT